MRKASVLLMTTLTLEGWINFMTMNIAAATPAILQVTPEMFASACGRGGKFIGANYFRELPGVTSCAQLADMYGMNLKRVMRRRCGIQRSHGGETNSAHMVSHDITKNDAIDEKLR